MILLLLFTVSLLVALMLFVRYMAKRSTPRKVPSQTELLRMAPDELRVHLRSPNNGLVALAVEVAGIRQMTDEVLAAINHPNPHVQATAIGVLNGSEHASEHVFIVIAGDEKRHPDVRRAALDAIEDMRECS